jgi:hypothetical protein
VKIFPDRGETETSVSLYANPEQRRHAPIAALQPMGYVPASDLDAIARAVADERAAVADLSERRRRRQLMAAARAARARRAAA